MVIAAFAGVGKTYFCENVEKPKDLVCMPFKYFIIPSDRRVLKGLKDKHIPYILCYPESVVKEEYKRRYG